MTPSVKVVGALLVAVSAWFGLTYLLVCNFARSVE